MGFICSTYDVAVGLFSVDAVLLVGDAVITAEDA